MYNYIFYILRIIIKNTEKEIIKQTKSQRKMKNLRIDSEVADNQPDYLSQELKVSLTGEQVQAIVLKVMDEQNPHSVLVTNTILGRMFATEDVAGIGMLITACLGIEKKINIEVGATYNCNATTYRNGSNTEIGQCIVVRTNPYKDKYPVEVEYTFIDSSSSPKKTKTWVAIESLSFM
jgi:Lhr-like helicase